MDIGRARLHPRQWPKIGVGQPKRLIFLIITERKTWMIQHCKIEKSCLFYFDFFKECKGFWLGTISLFGRISSIIFYQLSRLCIIRIFITVLVVLVLVLFIVSFNGYQIEKIMRKLLFIFFFFIGKRYILSQCSWNFFWNSVSTFSLWRLEDIAKAQGTNGVKEKRLRSTIFLVRFCDFFYNLNMFPLLKLWMKLSSDCLNLGVVI